MKVWKSDLCCCNWPKIHIFDLHMSLSFCFSQNNASAISLCLSLSISLFLSPYLYLSRSLYLPLHSLSLLLSPSPSFPFFSLPPLPLSLSLSLSLSSSPFYLSPFLPFLSLSLFLFISSPLSLKGRHNIFALGHATTTTGMPLFPLHYIPNISKVLASRHNSKSLNNTREMSEQNTVHTIHICPLKDYEAEDQSCHWASIF